MTIGTVYLLHFDRPYHHARHYIGFTRNLERRLAQHRRGKYGPLLRAVRDAGIKFRLAREWRNVTRKFERRLHLLHGVYVCPWCTLRVAHRGLPRPSDFEDEPAIASGRSTNRRG